MNSTQPRHPKPRSAITSPSISRRRSVPAPSAAPISRASSRTMLGQWAYRAESTRDLRLDLMRGFAVFVMIADHLGGASWLRLITGGNVFLTSAAEFFVFISGWVGGMVWGAVAREKGLRVGIWKLIRRAGTLYALTVVLTIGFGSYSIFFHLPWSNDISYPDWLALVENAAILKQSLFLVDIPLLYTLLLAAAPIALWLLCTRHTLWLVLGSLSLWLLFQIFGFEIPWHIPGYGFQFAAWQLLFFTGMAIGFHQRALARRFNRVSLGVCFIFAALLFLGLIAFYQGAVAENTGSEPIASSVPFLKSALAPGRVGAFVIALVFIFLGVHLFWTPIQFLSGWLLLPLGQNALYSYTMHVLLAGLYAVVLPGEWITSLEINTILQWVGILAIWLMIQVQFPFSIGKRNAKPAARSIRIDGKGERESQNSRRR